MITEFEFLYFEYNSNWKKGGMENEPIGEILKTLNQSWNSYFPIVPIGWGASTIVNMMFSIPLLLRRFYLQAGRDKPFVQIHFSSEPGCHPGNGVFDSFISTKDTNKRPFQIWPDIRKTKQNFEYITFKKSYNSAKRKKTGERERERKKDGKGDERERGKEKELNTTVSRWKLQHVFSISIAGILEPRSIWARLQIPSCFAYVILSSAHSSEFKFLCFNLIQPSENSVTFQTRVP